MSTKLNQIIAVANGKKATGTAALTAVYHVLQKPDLFTGFERKYQSLDDDGEKLPSESKIIQQTVAGNLAAAQESLTDVMDIVATQEYGNCSAKADIVIDGVVLAEKVPVTYILFLEKQADNIKSLISKLPVLSSDTRWNKSGSDPNVYVTDVVQTNRTKKVPKAFVKAPATDKHPAQVEMFTEDVIVGNWNKVDMSSAIPISQRDEMLKRVEKFREALKVAREEANSIQVTNVTIGKGIMNYLLARP